MAKYKIDVHVEIKECDADTTINHEIIKSTGARSTPLLQPMCAFFGSNLPKQICF